MRNFITCFIRHVISYPRQALGAFNFVVVIFSAKVLLLLYLPKIFGIASLTLAWINNEI